jgi:hypothetical protein
MRINDLTNEEKVRLDPKCWTGKKIGNPKTKVKGGVRVNNCVPAESVAEGTQRVDSLVTDALKIMRGSEASDAVAALKTVLGDREYNSRRGFYNFYIKQMLDMYGQQGLAEKIDSRFRKTEWIPIADALKILKHYGATIEEWGGHFHFAYYDREGVRKRIEDLTWNADDTRNVRLSILNQAVRELKAQQQGMTEDYNPEYDDEAGMADNNLETLQRAVDGIDDLIQAGDNLPEWCQEKIAVAKSMLVAVWDYMESEEDSEEVDPEVDEMFEAMDQLAEEMAVKHGLDVDTVWEGFEAMDDNMLYETAAWRRKEGKSKSGGLNAKGVASYRRENPGSKLQTAVTTKPSKLKKGSKAAKRRKSFCARMGGVKGPMKKPNGKPTRKALALRKWNC